MIQEAILKINPDAVATVSGEDINTCEIEWHNGTTPISKSDIEAKMNELQAEYDAEEWKRNRQAEYPSIIDQLDDIYHNGIDGWKTTIKAVKDKYPK
tara:strand:- start:98 stop:388 length:291 start_codon:yes stop_codon:yes gene_type:complete